ncbi:uncharacterized protein [Montipora foliosa]|uniref:uncharacterized protein n=1 Tax=Montipora foliosa TaxID=591990 RepID=UPI0035F0FCFD
MAECVQLKQLQLGQRKLRFLEWNCANQVNSDGDVIQNNIPLFLGADVMSACSTAVSNLPRMHAKFSKQGLAVKVNFPTSVRLHGVHGSTRGVWFYSIQGLFRVCFEYYNREEQLDCLTLLCPIWKQRYSDPVFHQEIELGSHNTTAYGTGTQTDTPDIIDHLSLTETQRNQTAENLTTTGTTKLFQDNGASVTPTGEKCIKELLLTCTNEGQSKLNSLAVTIMKILKDLEGQRSPGCNGSSQVLTEISKYLGDEFHKLQLQIAERVTDFKKRHITSIDNLPPASELVKELFPDCMRVLLLHWIGNQDQQNVNSIIQVILELANTSLVSGVAHVMYSRLIRTHTV